MQRKNKKYLLKEIFWDYNIPYSEQEIYNFLSGKRKLKVLEREKIIARMLITLRWYEIIDIFGLKQVKKMLTDDVIKFLWKKNIKERFYYVRKRLQ